MDAKLKMATGLYGTIPPEYPSAFFYLRIGDQGSCEGAKNERSADLSNRSGREIAMTVY